MTGLVNRRLAQLLADGRWLLGYLFSASPRGWRATRAGASGCSAHAAWPPSPWWWRCAR
jgi:hypothetical protein